MVTAVLQEDVKWTALVAWRAKGVMCRRRHFGSRRLQGEPSLSPSYRGLRPLTGTKIVACSGSAAANPAHRKLRLFQLLQLALQECDMLFFLRRQFAAQLLLQPGRQFAGEGLE